MGLVKVNPKWKGLYEEIFSSILCQPKYFQGLRAKQTNNIDRKAAKVSDELLNSALGSRRGNTFKEAYLFAIVIGVK